MLDVFYSTEIYDFQLDKWEYGPELNASKGGHSMIQLRDRYLYCFGGFFFQPEGYEIEMLDTKAEDELDKKWIKLVVNAIPAMSN